METSRFSNNANLTNHTQLQISDDTETTKVIKEIKYYSGLPEIPTPEAAPDTQFFRDRGALQAVEIGEDQVEFPEMSITIDMTAADVQDVGISDWQADWYNIMNKYCDPADGTTNLTSTNTGSVNVKNGFNPSSSATTSVTIPSDIDTLRLEILFQDGTNTLGYRWEQVQPLGVTFGDNDGRATMTLNFKVWCCPTEISELTANA